MSATSAAMQRNGGQLIPQGYNSDSDTYKATLVDANGNILIARARGTLSATIANGASLSGVIDLDGYAATAIEMPADWTAAVITFAACSTSGGTYAPLYDCYGNEVFVTNVGAARVIALDAIAPSLAMVRYLKLRSGTSGTPVNQGAERAFSLICKS